MDSGSFDTALDWPGADSLERVSIKESPSRRYSNNISISTRVWGILPEFFSVRMTLLLGLSTLILTPLCWTILRCVINVRPS